MSIPPPPSTPPRVPGENDGDDERSLTGEIFSTGSDVPAPDPEPPGAVPPAGPPWGAVPPVEPRLPAAHQWPGDLAGEPRGANEPFAAGSPGAHGVHDLNRQQAAQYWESAPAGAPPGPASPPPPAPPVAYGRQKPARSRGPVAYLVIAGVAVLALIVGAVLGANLLPPKNEQAASAPVPSVSVSPLPSSQPSSPAQPPASGAGTPPTATPSGGVPVDLARFSSPSKNISCMIDGGAVRCDIVKKAYKDPEKPADCQGSFGRSLTANTAGVTFGCVGDTVADPSLPVLGYDQTSAVQGVTCTSRTTGIRCTVDATGHGFNLASADYEIF